MTSSDLPEGTANDTSALGFDQGVEALADILDAPETDLEGNKPETLASTEEPEGEQPEETEDEELVIEDDPEPSEEADGPEEIKGGQFAPDTAKVTLSDGTVISIAELKRNNLFQRDYSLKTTELKAERTAFEAEKQKTQELQAQAHEVTQMRDFVLSMYQQAMPQPPDKSLMETDIIGYWQAKEAYDERVNQLNYLHGLQEQDKQRKAQEEGQAYQNAVRRELELLNEKLPELKDQGRREQFRTEVVDALAPYGFSAEEIGTVVDHRMLLVCKDIVRLQKALRKAPQVKQEIQQKPKLISGGKRMDPKARISRDAQVRSEQLRKTGTLEAGAAALIDII